MSDDRWEVRENGRTLYRVDMPADDSDAAMDMCFLFADERMAAHPNAHIQVFQNAKRVFDSVEDVGIGAGDEPEDAEDVTEELSAWSTRELVAALRAREGVAAYVVEPYASTDVRVEGPAIALVVTD